MKNKDYTEFLSMTPQEFRKRQWSKGWALSFIGLIVYAVLRLFGNKPKDFHGICPYFEVGKDWGGFEMGWFFVCAKNSSESLKCHELGHGIQNAVFGGFSMLFYSICSTIRYWYRKIFGAKTKYDAWWFEGQATKYGYEYIKLWEVRS